VQRVSSTLPDTVDYHEINLARFGQQEFVDALGRLDEAARPCLCRVDEIDGKPKDVAVSIAGDLENRFGAVEN